MVDTSLYVTVNEAARSLDVTETAVRNAILQGRLTAIRLYGRWLIHRTDLEAYRARTRPTGEKPRGRPKKRGKSAG